jgi:hypothetical protein
MYVVVHHEISDPEKFLSIVQAGAPDNADFKVLAFLPAVSHTKATCFWEATSVNSLQEFLEPILGGSSKNTYLQVDETIAMLPARKESLVM